MKENTTYEIFISFVVALPDGSYDATSVVSKQCYNKWLKTRRVVPQNPPHAFRKALTGHCRGDKGLQPYPPHIEEAILKVLRTSKIWSCFEGTNISIGKRGFQTHGFWEKKRKRESKQNPFFQEYNFSIKKKSKPEAGLMIPSKMQIRNLPFDKMVNSGVNEQTRPLNYLGGYMANPATLNFNIPSQIPLYPWYPPVQGVQQQTDQISSALYSLLLSNYLSPSLEN